MKKKRKNPYRRSRGAVTVFLTLVLVPCLIFVCAFGDASRVALSKSQATSASDLALYSLMSKYDEDLKEWYGLVASCQNVEDFFNTSASYFDGMMSAEGIDGATRELFSQYLSALQTGEDFMDFLQVEITGETKVEALADSSMANPALLEDGIVEFMKYRGPVEIVANIIDRFSKMELSDKLEDANEDEPIVEAKQEYAKAEGELLSAVFYTFLATQNYQEYLEKNGVPDLEKIQNVCGEELSKIYDDLGKVTELITKYYAFTSGLKDLRDTLPLVEELPTVSGSGTNISVSYNGKTYKPTDIGAKLNADETGYDIDDQKASELAENYNTWASNVANAAGRIVSACGSIPAPSNSASDDVNPAVYLMKMQNTLSSSDLKTISDNGNKLMEAYAKILLAIACGVPNKTTGEALADARDDIAEEWTNYLSYSVNQDTKLEIILKQYNDAAKVNYPAITKMTYEFQSEYCNASVTVGGFFEKVREVYGTLAEELQMQIDRLNIVINGGSFTYDHNGKAYTAKSLEELKSLVVTYMEKREDWGDAIENSSSDSDYKKQEEANYSGEKNGEYVPNEQEEQLAALLREHGTGIIDDFGTRITNIRDLMQALLDALNGFTYGGTPVCTMTRTTAVSSAQTVIPTDYTQISTSLKQNEADAANYAAQLIQPPAGSPLYTPPSLVSGETGNHPDLTVDIPAFYQFMREKLRTDQDEIVKNKDDNDKQNEEYKKQAETEKTSSQGYSADYVKGIGTKELTKFSDQSNTFGADDLLTGTVGVVKTLVEGNFGEFRDRLYVVEYAMDMFSYSSFNNEGKFDLNGNKEYTHADFVTNGYDYPKEAADAWGTVDPTKVYDNQSLTNRPINSDYNQINLAEVEYILYGKSTMEENLKTSYGNIFVLREALNLVAAFQCFYSASNPTSIAINAIADAVALSTAGVVPIPLTKVILLGVLATMETAHDVNRLKAGIPVALYKTINPGDYTDTDWYYAIDGFDVASFNVDKEPVDENGLYYSDYLYIFLCIGAQSESCYKGMLLRIGDLIGANMVKQGESGFDLSKAQCYFKLTSTVRVKPLLLALPIVDSFEVDGDTNAATLRESTDWCFYEVSVIRGYS